LIVFFRQTCWPEGHHTFKYRTEPASINIRFKWETKRFVAAIFNNCDNFKIWTDVDIASILDGYDTDRQQIITAMEYFDEKGLIELQSRKLIKVEDILNPTFDVGAMAEKDVYTF